MLLGVFIEIGNKDGIKYEKAFHWRGDFIQFLGNGGNAKEGLAQDASMSEVSAMREYFFIET